MRLDSRPFSPTLEFSLHTVSQTLKQQMIPADCEASCRLELITLGYVGDDSSLCTTVHLHTNLQSQLGVFADAELKD